MNDGHAGNGGRPVDAVLFDLDNTLTDRAAMIRRYAERFAEDFDAALAAASIPDVERAVVAADGEGRNPDRVRVLWESLRWRNRPALVQVERHWVSVAPTCVVARPDAAATVAELRERGVRLGLVTNGGTGVQTLKIDAIGLEGVFDVIAISEAVGVAKPDPKIFQLVLEHLVVTPGRALFVGDDPVNDIGGATAAGIRAVWLTCSGRWPEAAPPPPLTVDTLGEVLSLVSPKES